MLPLDEILGNIQLLEKNENLTEKKIEEIYKQTSYLIKDLDFKKNKQIKDLDLKKNKQIKDLDLKLDKEFLEELKKFLKRLDNILRDCKSIF